MKKFISFFEMFVLIIGIFSFSYFIFSSSENAELIPLVSAETSTIKCCEKTISGGTCVDVLDSSQCVAGANLAPSSCSATSFCKLGCCVDEEEGTYDKNVPQALCHGVWKDDANCNVAGADFGCCVVGDRTYYLTERACELKTERRGNGSVVDWSFGKNEAQCLASATYQETGACVLENKGVRNCKFSTRSECIGLSGEFNQGYLCTSKILNTTCEKTKETTCVDGKDEVYFVDSCGNPANIYDSLKIEDDFYWEIISYKEESCNADLGNANSETCGNCDRYLGGICSSADEDNFDVEYGDFYCKDLSCTYKGVNYKNGESWCVYDGKIGNGDDVVGSRHWKYVCSQGEIQVEPCADFRNEICVQSDSAIDDGIFRSASCRVNGWQNCINANMGEGGCSGFDCELSKVNVDTKFQFDVCTPKYPAKASEDVCNLASTKCDVLYVKEPKGLFGGSGEWECVENCNCEKAIFTQQLNDVCRKLGDCGGYVNIEGVYTDAGYNVVNAPKVSNSYSSNHIPVAGQKANPGSLSELGAGGILGNLNSGSSLNQEDYIDEEEGTSMTSSVLVSVGLSGTGWALGKLSSKMLAAQVAAGGSANLISLQGAFESAQSAWYSANQVAETATRDLGQATFGLGSNPTAIMEAQEAVDSAVIAKDVAYQNYLDASSKYQSALNPSPTPSILSGFANVLMTTGIVYGMSSLIASLLDIQTSGSGTIAGIVAGVAATYAVAIYQASQSGAFAMAGGGTAWGQVLGAVFTNTAGFGPGILAYGVGISVAVLVMYLFSDVFGGSVETKIVTVTFTCSSWVPPSGASNCKSCNEDPLKPCSEYRCKSLGAGCELINKGTDQELCVASGNNGAPPTITPNIGAISENLNYGDVDENGFRITNSNGGCVDAYTNLNFGIETNEPAFCKFDLQEKDFDEMSFNFGSSVYLYNHTTTFMLPDPSHGQSNGLNWTGDLTLYVKCIDAYGNEIPGFFEIGMCVNQGEDVTPPMINGVSPLIGSYLNYASTEQQVTIQTNELSECRWSLQDKDYEVMENQMTCDSEFKDVGNYFCFDVLPTENSENKYYIKCKDQPWLEGTDEENRNSNQESFEYILNKPKEKLVIDWIEPYEDIETNSHSATVDLKVETGGGGLVHKCYYSFSGYENMTLFYDTFSTKHSQEFNLATGRYKIYIQCEDETGEVVQDKTDFRITYDSATPQVARIWQKDGKVYFITTENAECKYSTKNCNFNFNTADTTGNSENHEINVVKGNTYYIRCEDEFGNVPSGCSFVFRAT